MNNIGFIDYRYDKNIIRRIFKKISIKKNEFGVFFYANTAIINDKLKRKLEKLFLKYSIESVMVSKTINVQGNFNINVLTGKRLFKNIIVLVLEYICNVVNTTLEFQEVFIACNSNKEVSIISQISSKVKCVNIITNNIKNMKRLNRFLEEDEAIVYSISNNTRKSLKKAVLIVNVDFKMEDFEQYKLNRNAIILNLSSNVLKYNNSFQGLIIEGIDGIFNTKSQTSNNIDKACEVLSNFKESQILEYLFLKFDNQEIMKYVFNSFSISDLVGHNGSISNEELKNKVIK